MFLTKSSISDKRFSATIKYQSYITYFRMNMRDFFQYNLQRFFLKFFPV